MQKMTSAYANKMLSSLEEDKAFWVNKEAASSTYVVANNEEPVVPEYDYAEVAATIAEIDEKIAIIKHALKNALIPVVTYIGVDFGGMLSGAILTETVFNWPGIGYEVYRAISMRDWPIVMGGVTLIVVVVMVINLLVDISYAFLDPRIRLGGPSDKA